jgi:DNA-binding transcriptional ArsR family regulator
MNYEHPSVEEISLAKVMRALADPCRLHIIQTLIVRKGDRLACKAFDLDVSKATASHHFEVLREAGLIHTECEGTKSLTTLRSTDLKNRFPGLLDLLENETNLQPISHEL